MPFKSFEFESIDDHLRSDGLRTSYPRRNSLTDAPKAGVDSPALRRYNRDMQRSYRQRKNKHRAKRCQKRLAAIEFCAIQLVAIYFLMDARANFPRNARMRRKAHARIRRSHGNREPQQLPSPSIE
ncbi:hypothetical protein CEXT_461891 [Caerostris extrusa]|uniref:BZIP domain-containing protein n=1 Tax=Caerostris extrusa TaxID=172846 RepID=A0AAV4VS14_CAEEX|nr:hypothetical protein CEXT_461891 [Caerostris extrusa]